MYYISNYSMICYIFVLIYLKIKWTLNELYLRDTGAKPNLWYLRIFLIFFSFFTLCFGYYILIKKYNVMDLQMCTHNVKNKKKTVVRSSKNYTCLPINLSQILNSYFQVSAKHFTQAFGFKSCHLFIAVIEKS